MREAIAVVFVLIAGVASAQPIICPPDAAPNVRLTGARSSPVRLLAHREAVADCGSRQGVCLANRSGMDAQAYRIDPAGISGGSDLGVLYGAYRYAEILGVRFYLHGDVVPDARLKELPHVQESGKPLFRLRGVNPWGSHPFGFDAWNADDYKAVFTQLAKMRMNFLGVHCYPEGHPYAEPTVWHGLAGDCDAQGRVTASYVSRYFNALLTPGWGDYRPKKTGDYSLGGSLLFDDDAWAPAVLRGYCPLPTTPHACNNVFNRMGAQFHDAFTFARRLGVKTCVGTEAPLTIPAGPAQRLRAQGKSSRDPAVVREIYETTFRRIMASHPLDYYWIWTPEGWTWTGNNEAQYQATVADIKLAIEAWKASRALSTCHVRLGPRSGTRPGGVRPRSAQGHSYDRHRPRPRRRGSRTGAAARRRSRQMGDSLAGKRCAARTGRPATVGRPYAPRRGGRPPVRLHRTDGPPVADRDHRTQHLSPGEGRMGPKLVQGCERVDGAGPDRR